MKRFFLLSVCLVLSVSLLCCCNNETGYESKETDTVIEAWTANAEELSKANDEATYVQLMRGIWVTPRFDSIPTERKANERYAEIAEAGINMVYTHGEESNSKWLNLVLDAAKNNGVKVMISLPRIAEGGNGRQQMSLVNRTKDNEAVLGYNMFDEPSYTLFDTLASLQTQIKEAVGDSKVIMGNLFPNYAPNELLADKTKEGTTFYRTYCENFMDMIKPNVLSFDYYPYRADKTRDDKLIKNMLLNLCDITETAKKHNVPTWGFVQNSMWSGTRIPNENELRFLTHAHLIFGLKSYTYFLYWQPSATSGAEGVFEGMVTYDGTRTEIYDRVKAQNKEIDGMKGIYLKYDNVGFLTDNLEEVFTDGITKSSRLESFANISEIEASQQSVLTGCFENKEDGSRGIYLLNFDTENEVVADVNFNTMTEYTLYGDEGIEILGRDSSLSFTLRPGEGVFVELGEVYDK